MQVVDCDISYCESILAILNDAIVNTTALYDYRPRMPDSMVGWFEAKRRGDFPVIGVTSDAGELMGFASYGVFRAWPAYKYTVEHSVYVASPFRGRGLGKLLLSNVIDRATRQDYHVLVGGIDSDNAASIALHKHFHFEHVATLKQVGFKFGRRLDLCFYQRVLDAPGKPVDGDKR